MVAVIKSSISYYDYDTRLRIPEQEKAERLLVERKHFILGFEPGKGKSYPVIHAIKMVERIKGRPCKVLILSDADCIKNMWKLEMLPQGILPHETYFVTDRTAIGAVQTALLSKDWDIIICDECQSLRSGVTRSKSQYSKLVYQLAKKTEYVWGMTGTLSGNNNMEPFCVMHNLHVAGMGEINCRKFKMQYCNQALKFGPFGSFMQPVGLNEAGERLMEVAYEEGVMFWPWDDKDDMPECDIREITFNVEATREYKNALEGILKLGEHESTTMKAIALQKAQQALNGFLYYDENGARQIYTVEGYNNPKIKYVVDQCRIENNIIAYRFQEDGASIKKALDSANIFYVTKIKEFKEYLQAGTKVCLIIQCSKGKAVNLQLCQSIIYYTSDFSFISYKQMIHRCWRRGQKYACKVTFLINDPGDKYKVELKIWSSLRTKQTVHDALMSIKCA